MESAAELHEARVLRARIEVREADLAALSPSHASPEVLAGLEAEIGRLKADYRRLLARQADLDYRRRRAEWRAQGGRRNASACA